MGSAEGASSPKSNDEESTDKVPLSEGYGKDATHRDTGDRVTSAAAVQIPAQIG